MNCKQAQRYIETCMSWGVSTEPELLYTTVRELSQLSVALFEESLNIHVHGCACIGDCTVHSLNIQT